MLKFENTKSINLRFPRSTASKYQKRLRRKFQEPNVRKYQKRDVKISPSMFPERNAKNFPKPSAHRIL